MNNRHLKKAASLFLALCMVMNPLLSSYAATAEVLTEVKEVSSAIEMTEETENLIVESTEDSEIFKEITEIAEAEPESAAETETESPAETESESSAEAETEGPAENETEAEKTADVSVDEVTVPEESESVETTTPIEVYEEQEEIFPEETEAMIQSDKTEEADIENISTVTAVEEVLEVQENEYPAEEIIWADENVLYSFEGTADSEVTLKKFQVSLKEGAEPDEQGNYVWKAEDSSEGHGFKFRVSYDLSANEEYQPGEIEFKVPATILVNREGEPADTFDISVPEENDEGINESVDFVFKREGDELVVTNRLPVPARWAGYFEIAYFTTERTFSYVDYGSANGKNEKGGSEPFKASVHVVKGNADIEKESDGIPVYIDTFVVINSAQKIQYGTLLTSWDESWGEKPLDADDYYYLIWTVRSFIGLNSTQPYSLRLTDDFSGDGCSVVGYRMGTGSNRFTSENISENNTRLEYRYDYVLTRHKKEIYDAILERDKEYRLNNYVTVEMIPADGADPSVQKKCSCSWDFRIKRFEHPIGQFYTEKYGLDYLNTVVHDSDDISSFMLDELRKGSIKGGVDEIDGLRYFAYVEGNAYPWTTKTPDDPLSYAKIPADVILTDNEFVLDRETEKMGPQDYEIRSLDMRCRNTYKVYDEKECTFITTDEKPEKDELISVLVERNGSGEFEKAAVYNVEEGAFSEENADLVKDTAGTKIFFTENVTGYRLAFQTVRYYYNYGAYVEIALKNSGRVLSVIGNKKKIFIHNTENSKLMSRLADENCDFGDGTQVFSLTKSADIYIMGIERDGHIVKKALNYKNNKIQKEVEVSWDINVYEDYHDIDTRLLRVKQQSGVFYDLLPAGSVFKEGSVTASANGETLSYGSYSVKTEENFRNSGRTLLTVFFDIPAELYSFQYTSVHPWDEMKDTGKKFHNTAAYETGNATIGGGYPDNAEGLKMQEIMKDLDPKTDAEKFIYSERVYDPIVVTSGNLGLKKLVRGNENGSYLSSSKVYPDQDYSYYIRFATDDSETAKDLIVYDSLENYELQTGETSDWRGSFRGLDLSEIRTLGIDPVVYYATEEDLSIEDTAVNELSGSIWTEASAYSGSISDVKAVAVDLRKGMDGSEFILPADTGVSLKILMHSPEKTDTVGHEPYAYNNVYLQNNVIDAFGEESGIGLIHQDYTKAYFIVTGDISIRKTDSSDSSVTIPGVSFSLTGISDYGNKIEMTVKTGSKGTATFTKVEKGTYEIRETETTEDYLLNETVWTVTVGDDGKMHIEGQDGAGVLEVKNDPRIHGDFKLQKKGLVDFHPGVTRNLPGAVFRLSGTSDYGREYLLYAETDGGGIAAFNDVELGTYELTEVSAPEGYRDSDEIYTVICDENGNLYLKESGSVGDMPVLFNQPYHTLNIKKLDAFNTAVTLSGAEFTLKGTSDEGTPVNLTAVSDQYGTVTFTGLEEGTYALCELTAPEHYERDEGSRLITVGEDGAVTGLTSYSEYTEETGYEGYYAFLNERKYEGTITVTKVWDDTDESGRPVPVVNLSNEEPDGRSYTTAISFGRWNDNKDNWKTAVSFERCEDLIKVSELPENAIRIDDGSGDCEVYAWLDAENHLFWWSDAEIVYLPGCMNDWFYYFVSLKTASFEDLDGSNVKQMSRAFYNNVSLETLDLSNFNTSGGMDLNNTFYNCSSLTSLDLSGFDTSGPSELYQTFYNCRNLEELNVSSFDTTYVMNMNRLFCDCSSLKKLDVSGFDTSNVLNMEEMFEGCSSLTELDLSGFDTDSVTSMRYMFSRCTSLQELIMPETFVTSRVTDLTGMFNECRSLEAIDLTGFDTSKVTSMNSLFNNCSVLQKIDLHLFDTSHVTEMSSMFRGCGALEEIKGLSGFNTEQVSNFENMFMDCTSLTELDLVSFRVYKGEKTGSMFAGCTNLVTIYAADGWNTYQPYASNVFYGCESLVGGNGTAYQVSYVNSAMAAIDQEGKAGYLTLKEGTASLSDGKTVFPSADEVHAELHRRFDADGGSTSITSFGRSSELPDVVVLPGKNPDGSYPVYFWIDDNGAFLWYSEAEKVYMNPDITFLFKDTYKDGKWYINCWANMKEVSFEGLDGSLVTNMSGLFRELRNLETVDFCGLNIPNVKNMSRMFCYCEALKNVDLSGVDTSNVTDMSQMFNGCYALPELDLSGFDTGNVTDMSDIFNCCYALKTVKFSAGFDTSKVTDMNGMFQYCTALESLDLTGFNTGNVTDMSYMFWQCKTLNELDVTGFDTGKVTDMSCMFDNCSSLKELDVTGFDTSNVKDMAAMFCGCALLTELNVKGFDTCNVTDMNCMFESCDSLETLDLSGFNTSKVTNLCYMFDGCSSLKFVDVSGFDTSNVAGMEGVFEDCTSLEYVDVSGFNTSKVPYMDLMFQNCASLKEVDVTGFDMTNVRDTESMFEGCSSLTELDLSGFDISGTSYVRYMFYGCTSLRTIYSDRSWKTSDKLNNDMFTDCVNLVGGNGTAYDSDHIDSLYAVIDGKNGAHGYFTYKKSKKDQNIRTTESVLYEGDDPDSAYDAWIDNGDGTWTYRFHVFDEDSTYYAWEDSAPGYTWKEDWDHSVKIDYTEGIPDAGATVTNTKDGRTETGSLILTKKVTGAYVKEDLTRAFTFTVTVLDGNGDPIPDGKYGGMRFTDGKATVYVQHNRSVSAEGLPAGSAYTIEEQKMEGFTETSEGEEGTIEGGKLSRAEFTNERLATTGILCISKEAEGGDPADQFIFDVVLDGTEIGGTQVFGSSVFTDGKASVSIKAGETAEIRLIPEGTAYTVTEREAYGYELAGSEETTGSITAGETSEAKFRNRKLPDEMIPEGGFTLAKKIGGAESDDLFDFVAVIEGLVPGKEYKLSDGSTYKAGLTGTAGVNVALSGGESISFTGLPVGAKYTVTEKVSDYKASYEIKDSNRLGLITGTGKANTQKKKSLQTMQETVDKGEDITVTFTNTPETRMVYFGKALTDGDFLSGAEMEILGESGTMVYSFVSSGEEMTGFGLAEGNYTLHEKKAPTGYLTAEDIMFHVNKDGVVTIGMTEEPYVLMTDEPLKAEVIKKDENGEPLPGAVLAIYEKEAVAADGTVSEEADPITVFKTTAEPKDVSTVLESGKEYALTELTAPEGYAVAVPVYFTAPVAAEKLTVEMTDELKRYTLTYNQAGDGTYGVPGDAKTPDEEEIPYGKNADPLAKMPVTEWKTSDGKESGVRGTWTFSNYWTEDAENPGKADLTEGKIENIRENRAVYGKWTFTPEEVHELQIVNTTAGAKQGTGTGGKLSVINADGSEVQAEGDRTSLVRNATKVRFAPDEGYTYGKTFTVKYWLNGEDLSGAPHTVTVNGYIGADGKPVTGGAGSEESTTERFRKVYGELLQAYPELYVEEGSVILSFAAEAGNMPVRTVAEVNFVKKDPVEPTTEVPTTEAPTRPSYSGGGGGIVTPYPKGTTSAAVTEADAAGSGDGEDMDPFRMGILNATGDRTPMGLAAGLLILLMSALAAVEYTDKKRKK